MKKTHKRLSRPEIRKQLLVIAKLRNNGLSVAEACKKTGVPIPTYYFRSKSFTSIAPIGRRVSKVKIVTKSVDGRTLAALRRSKSKHATLAAKIREDLLVLRRVQRQLLRTVRHLG
jgi:hypothetical protein